MNRKIVIFIFIFIFLSPAYSGAAGEVIPKGHPNNLFTEDLLLIDNCPKRRSPIDETGKLFFYPRTELAPSEEFAVDANDFCGGKKNAVKIKIKFNDPQSCIGVFVNESAVKFKAAQNASLNGLPAEYFIEICGQDKETVKYIYGSIITVRKKYGIKLEFNLAGRKEVLESSEVFLAGDINAWSDKAMRLLPSPERKGFYSAVANNIEKGEYKYKLVVDGKWLYDSGNPLREPDGFGSFNSIFKVGDMPVRDTLIPLEAKREGLKTIFKIKYLGLAKCPVLVFMYDGVTPPADAISYSSQNNEFTVSFDGAKAGFECEPQRFIRYYSYSVSNDNKLESLSDEYVFYSTPAGSSGSNFRSSVIYFAMTDRFKNSECENDAPLRVRGLNEACDYMGGDFKGILHTARSGYFNRLGVDLLWISPALTGPSRAFRDASPPRRLFSGYHGYWPKSLDQCEPRFGNFKQLSEMVSELREKHSIDVLLDAVFRHVTIDSETYKRYPGLFLPLRLADGSKNVKLFDKYPESTWFDDFLPAFDYSKKEAVDFMVKKAGALIDASGVKGFRLDAVKHIPHSFWRELMRGRDNFFTVGETIDSREKISSYIGPGMLFSQFDFPLYFSIIDALAKPNNDFTKLNGEIKKSEDAFWYKHKLVSNLIGNHDFPRFMAYADNWFETPAAGDGKEMGFKTPPYVRNPKNYDKLKMAHALLMSLNGMAFIYYGDEYGETGAGDPDNRRMMRFENELNYFEKSNLENLVSLSRLRKLHPSLFEGVMVPLLVAGEQYAYAKCHFGESIFAVFNASPKASMVRFNPGRVLTNDYSKSGVCLRDLFSGEKFYSCGSGGVAVPVKSYGFRYLKAVCN